MTTLLRDTGQIMTTSRSFSSFYQIVSSIALGEVQYEYHIGPLLHCCRSPKSQNVTIL